MSGQNLILNTTPNDPTLSDLLNLLKKEIFLDLNCHHVGTIQSFNSAKQTVYASVNYSKTFFQLNTVTQMYQAVQVNYPTIVDAPLIILGGGTTHMTFPITKGDECLLLFNDRDIDNWYSSGGATQPVATGRLHAFTDAFALVGVKSTPKALTGYDAVRALLSNGNVSLGINPSNNKVTIENTSIGTLNSVLQNILTEIESLITQIALITVTPGSLAGPSSVPLNAAAISAISTQLSTYATQLGSLLE